MSLGFHDTATGVDVHTPITFTFADQAARENTLNPNTGLAYTDDDLDKFAHQTDDNSLWMLIATVPTWLEIGGSTLLTDGSGTTANGDAVDLGGTVTTDAIFTPDTDGSYSFNVGADSTNRVDSFNAFAQEFAGLQSGSLNDRAFVSLFGDTLGAGIQVGYFQNETDLLGINFNLFDSGQMVAVDQINEVGIQYQSDYSANYVDRSLVDKGYVDGIAGTNGGIYAGSGTLSGNTTVTGNSSDDLTFNHYNGTSTTYTLRSALSLTDTNITIEAALGDGFGTDLATDSISFTNSGMSINTEIGDGDFFQHGNDWKWYEGSSDSSTQTLTVHGDGNHSVFDPYITLHEGFATSNGTNAQDLVVNFGKGNLVKFNDGTRSVTTFSIKSVVNGSENFTHMEHNYEGVQQDFLNIRSFNWYMDTTGSPLWTIYDDDSGTNTLFTFDNSGNLEIAGNYTVPTVTDPNDKWYMRNNGASGLEFAFYDDSETTTTAYMTIGGNAGTVTFFNNMVLGAGNDVRIGTDLTADDQWRFVGGISDDTFRLEYYDDSATSTTDVLTATASGDVSILTGLKVAGEDIVPTFPSTVVGTSLAQTVTTTDAVIPLTSIKVDAAGSEYTVSTVSNNITFDEGDGSKVYEISMFGRYDLEGGTSTGATRSYGIITPRLGGVADTDYECWDYIREYQGGTNGIPNTSSALTFQIQPTASQVLDFVVRGTTEGGQTLTDFELDGFVCTVKRLL